jgi:two-component sensor histidine kinase
MPESGALMLTVGDDGVGMDTSHTGRTAGSLGMQLVNDLSQQLGGSLTILETPGRTVALQFVPNPLQT